jgi:hypothetical protein
VRPLSAGILNPVLNDFQPAQWRPASIRWLDESLHFIALGDDDVLDTKGLDHERNARGLFSVTTRFGRLGELIKTVGASIFGGANVFHPRSIRRPAGDDPKAILWSRPSG